MPLVPIVVVLVIGGILLLMKPAGKIKRSIANDRILVTFPLDSAPADRQRVTIAPSELHAKAEKAAGFDFPFDAFLLATMASSEHNGYSVPESVKAAVMHVALNNARKSRKSLRQLLIPDGKLGAQRGRYAATKRAPRLYDVLIADAVLDGDIPDFTGGAIQFDSPRAQDALYEQGREDDDANSIAQKRISAGRTLVLLPGVDPRTIRFWA